MPPGSKPSIAANSDYPAITKGRVGLEPTHWRLTSACSAAELPTRFEAAGKFRSPIRDLETMANGFKADWLATTFPTATQEVPCGNRTRLFSLEG